jgi:Tat protein translocase TatB subunit
MFGIGLPELILILIVALLVVGPERLPDLARTVARYVVELKRAANSIKDSLTEDVEPDSVLDREPRDFTVPEGFSLPEGLPRGGAGAGDGDGEQESGDAGGERAGAAVDDGGNGGPGPEDDRD